MSRYFSVIQYNGKNYCGWQRQPNAMSVQQKLEEAFSTLLRLPVSLTGAGRTDAGVHATHMVAHFDTDAIPDTKQLTTKINSFLPPDISVSHIFEVATSAHARFSAISRKYHYFVITGKSPFHYPYAWRLYTEPDYSAMNEASRHLLEYTDFTSFSKLHTDVKNNNCHIHSASWTPLSPDGMWRFEIQADRFLRNMVRAIVGTLIDVGRGKLSVEGFRRIIEAKDRAKASTSAPAHGLFLVNVDYGQGQLEPLTTGSITQ
ncbi:MAG: tRNA pseudouridine(38-40) synthase TruA [Tannerellaceae bacterium]|jgi:tRNA pseudouridine38-40 synthase|nr:tRNA pseudouridine(38-40) synthase TruA [Tannerellaceae bacterium]